MRMVDDFEKISQKGKCRDDFHLRRRSDRRERISNQKKRQRVAKREYMEFVAEILYEEATEEVKAEVNG